MNVPFYYQDGVFVCDGVEVVEIAREVGTPFYLYSARAICDAYTSLDRALADHPHTIHYALKAQSTLAILRLLRGLGSAADANSAGEIDVALRAGFLPTAIVFSGVGKTAEELERAVALGVKSLNVESAGELQRVEQTAMRLGTRARVSLRVNPDIDPESHPHISTGMRTTKFGMAPAEAMALVGTLGRRPALEPAGLHVHIGSQIASLEPLRRAAALVAGMARELRHAGIVLEHVDVGGGLAISYDGSTVPSLDAYGATLVDELRHSPLQLLVEPGRVLLGPAGVLVARVIDAKEQHGGKRFVVVDASMTELLRPALYGAFHRIEPARESGPTTQLAPCDVVGPVCETSDTLGADRLLPRLSVGDLLVIRDAGAYGFVMASNYNRRPLPPEVLVESSAWRVIRRRQSIEDQMALEQ
ncbi:MAG: diaminopimelate decarboxylase [Acidobacteria bacterium]|nr:diaminopimelate decarboxylase [Acidobacteriota bacterium]MBI3262656.1 diaminopimelate decarboxylase [Acidobacteriota bacterium]